MGSCEKHDKDSSLPTVCYILNIYRILFVDFTIVCFSYIIVNMNPKKAFIMLILFILVTAVYSKETTIKEYNLLQNSKILIDKSNKLLIEDIKSNQVDQSFINIMTMGNIIG